MLMTDDMAHTLSLNADRLRQLLANQTNDTTIRHRLGLVAVESPANRRTRSTTERTQGGAARLRRYALPWADMSWPFGPAGLAPTGRDGSLVADGSGGDGPGSVGGIFVSAGTLNGGGLIRARGGSANWGAGGGSLTGIDRPLSVGGSLTITYDYAARVR